MFVKICGITNPDDAQAAIDCGAGAVGFVFHPRSPRYVSPDAVAQWIDLIPRHVRRVGVFVNRSAADVEQTCRQLGLDVAQLHGSELPTDAPQAIPVWKAFRVTGSIPVEVDQYPADAVLLDGASSGVAFDWSLAREVRRPFILAGGLNERNVTQAIEETHPWAVDVSSSLELYPGKKDHARVARFLKACRQALSITR